MAAHPKPMPSRPTNVAVAHLRAVNASEKKSTPDSQQAVPAARAKAQFLRLLDQVEREGKPITISKRGRVVAQLVPPPQEKKISNYDRVYGSMAGTVKILGDIVSPDWDSWGPEWR